MDTTTPILAPIFLSHGSPMTALEPGEVGPFWQRLGLVLGAGQRPRAILAISAHSLAREPLLMAAARHTTVHDFGGFPEPLYQLRYDAPGAPALASQVTRMDTHAHTHTHCICYDTGRTGASYRAIRDVMRDI